MLDNNEKRVVIIGDLNARVGQEQVFPEDIVQRCPLLSENRRSKDDILNTKGRQLLKFCSEYGLGILNGRTKNDSEGNLTFIGAQGASCIDLALVSFDALHLVANFEVESEIFSDHLPISLEIFIDKAASCVGETNELPLLPKLNWKMQDPDTYRAKLETYTEETLLRNNGVDLTIQDLSNLIVRSASLSKNTRNTVFKQPWFNHQCLAARKRSFSLLNVYRKNSTPFNKLLYINANQEFRDLCRSKRREYYENFGDLLNNVKDSKGWWQLAKRLQGQRFNIGGNLDVSELKEHFKSLLNRPANPRQFQYPSPFIVINELDKDIDLEELTRVLVRMKNNKAAGPDKIPAEFFKNAPDNFQCNLLRAFNGIFETGIVPDSFTRSFIFPIFKKGDPNAPNNYRGVVFMDAVQKLFCGVLLDRLSEYVERQNILNECQAGFRSGYGTVDNIFNLYNLISVGWSVGKKKIYCLFVDFSAAFDSVDRRALFLKMCNLGISTKFINVLEGLYACTQSAVWNGAAYSDWLVSTSGVRQGCVLSPLLFALYLNDLSDFIGGGVTIESMNIRLLMYADDVAIIADNPTALQKMIGNLEDYCKLWNLSVNLSKTKILIFSKGGGVRSRSEKWFFENQEIEICKEYKYLGVIFTPKLSFQRHIKERLDIAKNSINVTWRKYVLKPNIKLTDKFKLYNAVSRAIMSYAAQVWGFIPFDEVDKLLRFFVKKVVGLQNCTPNYMLHLETGLPTASLFTLKMHYNYILKVISTMPDNRLPKILANIVIAKRISWYFSLCELAEKHDVTLNMTSLSSCLNDILFKETEWSQINNLEQARLSVRHDLYHELNHRIADESNYFNDSYNIKFVKCIFICRGGLLWLNANSFRTEGTSQCSVCNLGEEEDIVNFIGVCPIFRHYRVQSLGSRILSRDEVIDLLNGKDWNALYNYCSGAFKLRKILVEEYNS